MKNLTGKQRKAVDHYIEFRSKVDAYKFAYSCGNMTPKTIYRKACEVFDVPHVKAAAEAAISRVSEKAEINAAWVLKRTAMIADFNINRFLVFQDGLALYDFSEATDDDWYCIGELTIDQIGVSKDGKFLVDRIKLKPHSKERMLELTGKNVLVKAFESDISLNIPQLPALITRTIVDPKK